MKALEQQVTGSSKTETRDAIETAVLLGAEAIEGIAGEWDALVAGGEGAVFSGPAWCLAWNDAFPGRGLAAIIARQNGRLVGVLPLARTRTDARGLYFNRVAALARGDYQPPIVAPEAAPAVLPKLLDAAFNLFGHWGVYWWPNLPRDNSSVVILQQHLKSLGLFSSEEIETGFRLRFAGAEYSEVERLWSAKHRTDVRRQRKRLGEHGPISLWQPASLEEAEPVLEEFFDVHDEKWLSQGYPGKFDDPRHRLHYKAVLKRMYGRGLHFSAVRCGTVNVSYHFGFFAGNWLQWYKPTYRKEWAGYSPGKIHLALLAEEGCRLKWSGLDFLLGEDPYKNIWSNETTEVVNILCGFHQWAPAYVWFTWGKPFVRQRLQLQYLHARAWMQSLQRRVGGAGREQGK